MSPLFKKLNLKEQRVVHVLDAPREFEPELARLAGMEIRRSLRAGETTAFALGFARSQAELDAVSRVLIRAAGADCVLWVAYPKATSKRYRCDFNRDSGWRVLGAAGYEPVRQVAIDADWSALRFRKLERIKAFTRRAENALSSAGKRRAKR